MNWTGPDDDKTCRLDDATLRVEQMDTDLWWWSVSKGLYYDLDAEDFYYEFGYVSSKQSAIEAAEKAYRDHA